MKKLLIILLAAVLLAACDSGNEDEKTTEELKQELKESEKELEELYKEMNEKNSSDATETTQETNTEEMAEDAVVEDIEDDSEETQYNTNDIKWEVESVVDEDLNNTTITDLRINEDASVNEERYIVLVDLEWDVKNGADTTKEMLDMYSDHLAANLTDNKMIYELVLFWTVPYHNDSDSILKRTYENKDEGMYLEDEMKDINAFN